MRTARLVHEVSVLEEEADWERARAKAIAAVFYALALFTALVPFL